MKELCSSKAAAAANEERLSAELSTVSSIRRLCLLKQSVDLFIYF